MQKLTIQAVSERLKLPKSTIRYWEREFPHLIVPQRTQGGQRRYSLKDIAVLETIRDLKKSGMSLTQIKDHLMDNTADNNKLDPALPNQLADSIAIIVRREIYNFLKRG